MILINNYQILQRRFKKTLDIIKASEEQCINKPIEVIAAKNGMDTLIVEGKDKPVYIHSQYDPAKEAEAIIANYEDIDDYDCVLFYGVGLGYHIEEFARKYPTKRIVLYEPQIAIFYRYLCTKRLEDINPDNIDDILMEFQPNDVNELIPELIRDMNGKLLVIILPSYERLFHDQTKYFLTRFKAYAALYKSNLQTNSSFEKLWIVNSTLNLKKVLETPSIFQDCRGVLEKLPIILVSAGPSLNEEIENLRYIKEHKLAYIFSVGSANKTLLVNGIYPDAVCTYDPNTYNHIVFKEIIEQGINSIPLIFGSSVGNETLLQYPGPMVHVITGQDTVALNYLNQNGELDDSIVPDAPSIAVLMMEVLLKLSCGPIILVGQNFAFKNNQYYSTGIVYENRPNSLTGAEQDRLITVESVDGGQVYTFPEFNMMRVTMQNVIFKYPNREIINTTIGGAAIEGTQYISLDKLINERLVEPVVKENWHLIKPEGYNMDFALDRVSEMKKEYTELAQLLENAAVMIRRIDNYVKKKDSSQLTKYFSKFDDLNKKIFKNKCYGVFIKPMTRVHYDIFNREVGPLRSMKQPIQKAQKVVEVFGKYIYELHVVTKWYEQVLNKLHENIERAEQGVVI